MIQNMVSVEKKIEHTGAKDFNYKNLVTKYTGAK